MRRFLSFLLGLTIAIAITSCADMNVKAAKFESTWDSLKQYEVPQWNQDAKFGIFIHWGVYSIPGRGEWLMYQEHVPFEEYAPLADQFNPKDYNPSEWIALAKEAGMKYIVITNKF